MRLLLLLLSLTLSAAEPDWGKIIDAQNQHHPDQHEHHTPTPEPATWALISAGLVGVAAWRRKHL